MNIKKYLDRVRVGSEQAMICSSECPGCRRPVGETHSLGCQYEECPGCRKTLIGCNCNCLSPYDSARIIQALHGQFSKLADAVEVVTAAESGRGGEESYLIHAAMQFLYENIPAAARDGLHRLFQENHPGLVPQLQDETGYGYYTAEQLSVALRIPLAEVHEKIEAMVAAGQGIRFGDGIRLQKVN
ncbi:MAG: hypothetical protein ACD_75C02256G0003 [uncultured bacterium]|nr:MAG: hypothetical protein ACD_75C02256G0003 [uncultured bacterium]